MRRRKATDVELSALVAKMEDPKKVVTCPTCGNEIAYVENAHGCAAVCETCAIMTAERGL